MLEPITPPEEFERLVEVHDLCLLDTPAEERFDRLTRIAKRLFRVNIALVSLVDHDRQWFKSRQGLDTRETPRNISFCGHAILRDVPFVVQDAAADPRFADNPLVTGAPHLRFYAGMPLWGPNGYKVGTLCIMDQAPRLFSPNDADALRDLAGAVMTELATKELSLAADSVRQNESRLRQIIDTVPALIGYLDRDQRFRFHNRAYQEVFGLSSGQINGHTLAEVLGQKVYAGVQDKVEEVLSGYAVRYERVQMTPQGDVRNHAIQYFPLYGEDADEGKVLGFFSLGTDITELKRIDRMKTEFVSTVSHELRTPLTSIRGSLGLIAGGVAGELPEAVKNLVGIAKNNCERLIRLINDILDSEKIESGKMNLNLQPIDIRQLIQQALVANEGFASQHRVTMLLRAPDATLAVRIDSDRMTQVLTNLLSNAVKFSPPGGEVEVSVSRVAQGVRVEVADHGAGIPEEFRGRIFQKFSQADSSDIRQNAGTGLGLNISKALIEKMGGKIGFSSEAGAGTTFFLELPEWRNPALQARPARASAASSRPRILICEGDPDVARLINMMLGKAGFESDMAHSAAQALDYRARNKYDAVTVDLKLPGQDGVAFISALRGSEGKRNLPVVVISAQASEGELQFDRKPLAVTTWLEKPIDERQLIRSVRRAVADLGNGRSRILHVEDDADIQCIVAAIAQDFADFEFAATLGEARTLLRTHSFDLVLLDLGLGEDSGWDLFADIDALDPRPPVIVFSASDVEPAYGMQADAVLVKADTSNTELLNTIQRVLQISGDPGPTRPMELS